MEGNEWLLVKYYGNTSRLILPLCEVEGAALFAGNFWKLLELKKLLLSDWNIDLWVGCWLLLIPLLVECNPGGADDCCWCWCDWFKFAGEVPEIKYHWELLHHFQFIIYFQSDFTSANARINSKKENFLRLIFKILNVVYD